MRRPLLVLLAMAALVAGIVLLAEMTQNRPDAVRPGSVTEVAFDVATEDFQRGEAAAAAALWAVCAATVPGDVSTARPSGDAWSVTIAPAIGEHGRKRLVGCLEDVTIDRVVGRVVSIHAT